MKHESIFRFPYKRNHAKKFEIKQKNMPKELMNGDFLYL